jgi:glutathione S-transferase
MSDQPILYVGEKNISSWSMRAWVAATWKGIPFEERTILLAKDKDRAQRRKVSPTGKLPVLHHAGLVIPDSLAIIEYLEEAFPPPAYPALWPAERGERARARWMAAAMHSGYMKIREGMSYNLCFLPQRPVAPPDAMAEAQEVLALWETSLARPERNGGLQRSRRAFRHHGRPPLRLRRPHGSDAARRQVPERRHGGGAGEGVDGPGPDDDAGRDVLNGEGGQSPIPPAAPRSASSAARPRSPRSRRRRRARTSAAERRRARPAATPTRGPSRA